MNKRIFCISTLFQSHITISQVEGNFLPKKICDLKIFLCSNFFQSYTDMCQVEENFLPKKNMWSKICFVFQIFSKILLEIKLVLCSSLFVPRHSYDNFFAKKKLCKKLCSKIFIVSSFLPRKMELQISWTFFFVVQKILHPENGVWSKKYFCIRTYCDPKFCWCLQKILWSKNFSCYQNFFVFQQCSISH